MRKSKTRSSQQAGRDTCQSLPYYSLQCVCHFLCVFGLQPALFTNHVHHLNKENGHCQGAPSERHYYPPWCKLHDLSWVFSYTWQAIRGKQVLHKSGVSDVMITFIEEQMDFLTLGFYTHLSVNVNGATFPQR